ncbi:head assembly [Morganella phage MmP1]|uniref:Capsid assembly protein n=1 Tax=Morganella phage MmP1 TaxID=526118 RepID=B4YQG5_9CAUD|nr:head assembly [Morganella phage MmP1]ACF42035.1 capsid assembly protein [Morganella phage MmP1]
MSESNADVYAQFGVNNSVVTSGSVSEHEQNMLSLNVAARDGDDAIELAEVEPVDPTSDDPYAGLTDKFASEEDDNGYMQIRVGQDTITSEDELAQEGDENVDNVEESVADSGKEAVEFEALGETPEDLTKAATSLNSHEQGFQSMVEKAVADGLPAESIQRMYDEYKEGGLSEESYAELAKVNFTREFIDSYIQGQEALIDQYASSMVEYVGGNEKFAALMQHLQATDMTAFNSLDEALETRNIDLAKSLLNLAGQSYNLKFGKAAKRSVTKRAVQTKVTAPKVQGFTSQAEMIKAMSDKRYRDDAAYRHEVEQKVAYSRF